MSSSYAISPANCQKSQHQLRWSQVVWLHYHTNNPSDYKWSVVAASDIAATAKKREKKVGFSITEKFQLPRHVRALRRYKWCHNGTVINQFTQSNGQHKWQEKPALSLTWRPNSDCFPVQHSAFRAICIMKALCFQSSTHTVSSPSQAVCPVVVSPITWSRFLPDALQCINPLCFLLSYGFNKFFIWFHQSLFSFTHRVVLTP